MKQFFIGFSLTFFAITILAGVPVGGAMLVEYLGYDKDLGLLFGLALLLCMVAGLINWVSDDDSPMKYKVKIGEEEFKCNTISHEEDTDSIIVTMDGVESRVAIGTNIIITDK